MKTIMAAFRAVLIVALTVTIFLVSQGYAIQLPENPTFSVASVKGIQAVKGGVASSIPEATKTSLDRVISVVSDELAKTNTTSAAPAAGQAPTPFLESGEGGAFAPCSTLTYVINFDHAPASAEEDVKSAVANAHDATGLNFQYGGSSTLVPQSNWTEQYAHATKSSNTPPIIFAWVASGDTPRLSDGSAATGGPEFTEQDGKAVFTTGAVVVDYKQTSTFAPGSKDGTTTGTLLTHELGHVLGLGHSEDPHSTMYPVIEHTVLNSYAPADRAALATLYPKCS